MSDLHPGIFGPETAGKVRVGEVWTVDGHAYRVVKRLSTRSFIVQHLGRCDLEPPRLSLWQRIKSRLVGMREI